ncbi:MAG: sn-glycerol-3-phosphate ABC transporter ATP-binding protein UgpC [Alphaproteobacteria bacterium]|nr:sn-glycerol-3-phosphate ABC transporter ATP-binding protein UgpC [Alphaproteobacteria bacterium]
MAAIRIRDVVKNYGKLEVVHGINLDIAHNEFVVLVGPSGCGKSTTLRMIAGLEDITGGEIFIGDRVVNDLPPRKRDISMVFQNYALYPHMTVRENLGFGLKIAKLAKPVIEERVNEAAAILGIDELMERTPAELSGGQRQRVAMGRAIVRHPQVFLFDEPLSNLDAKLRVQMRTEIKRLHQTVRTTIVYVTHDQVEAMTLADRIVVMKDGYIEQVGSPLEVFEHPVNTFVATFIGSPPMNMIAGRIVKKDGHFHIAFQADQTVPVAADLARTVTEGQEVIFGFRADDLMPDEHAMPIPGASSRLRLKVDIAEPLGTETILFCNFAGKDIQAKMLNPRPVPPGEVMDFSLAIDKAHLFDAASGHNLRN